uniref:Uncharacterized protein n=1 Tax=Anguilla anguilla TaxID=7936 RepID=A0A0E9Q4N5_ANGAN
MCSFGKNICVVNRSLPRDASFYIVFLFRLLITVLDTKTLTE